MRKLEAKNEFGNAIEIHKPSNLHTTHCVSFG
jgi:hypothetical protein